MQADLSSLVYFSLCFLRLWLKYSWSGSVCDFHGHFLRQQISSFPEAGGEGGGGGGGEFG